MKDVIYLLFQLLSTTAKLLQPGGRRTVIAENLLLKQQQSLRRLAPGVWRSWSIDVRVVPVNPSWQSRIRKLAIKNKTV